MTNSGDDVLHNSFNTQYKKHMFPHSPLKPEEKKEFSPECISEFKPLTISTQITPDLK